MGVQINIKKADKDYSREITDICERLNISGDFTIEIYIDNNVEDIFEELYGYRISITGGIYEEINKRIFINLEGVSVRATLEHEFSHVKFNELYSKNNDRVLDFIDEYIANITEFNVALSIELPKEIKENLIEICKHEMENIDKLIKDNIVGVGKDKEQVYMRRIAKLLAYKYILEKLGAYDYKNIKYEVINGLCIWSDILDNVNYYNVNDKYEKSKQTYLEHITYLVR